MSDVVEKAVMCRRCGYRPVDGPGKKICAVCRVITAPDEPAPCKGCGKPKTTRCPSEPDYCANCCSHTHLSHGEMPRLTAVDVTIKAPESVTGKAITRCKDCPAWEEGPIGGVGLCRLSSPAPMGPDRETEGSVDDGCQWPKTGGEDGCTEAPCWTNSDVQSLESTQHDVEVLQRQVEEHDRCLQRMVREEVDNRLDKHDTELGSLTRVSKVTEIRVGALEDGKTARFIVLETARDAHNKRLIELEDNAHSPNQPDRPRIPMELAEPDGDGWIAKRLRALEVDGLHEWIDSTNKDLLELGTEINRLKGRLHDIDGTPFFHCEGELTPSLVEVVNALKAVLLGPCKPVVVKDGMPAAEQSRLDRRIDELAQEVRAINDVPVLRKSVRNLQRQEVELSNRLDVLIVALDGTEKRHASWTEGLETRIRHLEKLVTAPMTIEGGEIRYEDVPPKHPPGTFIDIVFDGPSGPEGPRFVEVEDHEGRGINFGKWVKREDGYHVIRFTRRDLGDPLGEVTNFGLLFSQREKMQEIICGELLAILRETEAGIKTRQIVAKLEKLCVTEPDKPPENPPHDLDREAMMVAAVLKYAGHEGNPGMVVAELLSLMRLEDFHSQAHRFTWAAMKYLRSKELDITPDSIVEVLRGRSDCQDEDLYVTVKDLERIRLAWSHRIDTIGIQAVKREATEIMKLSAGRRASK